MNSHETWWRSCEGHEDDMNSHETWWRSHGDDMGRHELSRDLVEIMGEDMRMT